MKSELNVIQIHPRDNVAVAIREIAAGEQITVGGTTVAAKEAIRKNHKIALAAIAAGQPVLKYGEPIGQASMAIAPGAWVHTHNLQGGG